MAMTIAYKDPGAKSIGAKCAEGWDIIVGELTMTGNYATGGYAMDLFAPNFSRALYVVIVPSISGYVFVYDYANKKLKVFYADYDAVADGALIEYPNDTALALSGVRFIAIGI